MSEVWFILLDGFDLYEASAAMQAFVVANGFACVAGQARRYLVRCLTNGAAPVRSNGEATLHADALPSALPARVEHVILVGGSSARQALLHPTSSEARLAAWIARERPRIGRLAAIGEGAFVVTSWRKRTPRDASSGDTGVAASLSGLELALRTITGDMGYRVSLQVAEKLAPAPERFGAPFRFRTGLTGHACGDERALALNRWIAAHLRQPLTNDQLSQRLAMTSRTFSRFYPRATGFTPARAVEHIRLEHACHVLETTLMSFKQIARRSGFSSEEVMRRAFIRVIKMSPSQYKRQLYGQV